MINQIKNRRETTNMQHMHLQHGLFAIFNGKHFVDGIGRNKKINFVM